MKLIFVYWAFEDQGSGLVIQGYTEAARALGHEVTVYGRPRPSIPLNYSLDVRSADAVVFLFEWTTALRYGDVFDLARLVGQVPRRRRVIVDGDAKYNDVIAAGGDYNHRDAAASQRWIGVCDSLADKICQPTLHPLRPNVRPFLFYAYNPAWERPLDLAAKPYGMVYVGHSKFRWRPMAQLLGALAPVRERVGRVGLVGYGWDAPPWWATPLDLEDAYFSDHAYLQELGVEVLPPVPFEQVIDWMGKAVFNPVISRPLFKQLRLVTPRVFETPAAGTIPVFGFDEAYVQEIYGEAALELVLDEDQPQKKILDVLGRPDHYADIVRGVRQHLAEKHSHAARLRELLEIVES
jgi:glycosyltransferase involved in cell wall biosynthesis